MSTDRVLYISYDGALDPLGRSQVLPYLLGLAQKGFRFDLVSFEKHAAANEQTLTQMQGELSRGRIAWHPLKYHKRPPVFSTAFDLANGLRRARRILSRERFRLIHARSYPAAAIAWQLSKRTGIPFIFDMRGLYADERTEGGLWPKNGVLFKTAKALEQRFLRDAAAVVTLTEASVPVVRGLMHAAGATCPLVVIPTCVDTERFRPTPRVTPFTLAYVGSVGTWYMLDEMLAFASTFLDTIIDSRVLFLVNDSVDLVTRRAREMGLSAERFRVQTAGHTEVPSALAGAAATFHFIRPTFSKLASAPTKFGESLALGLPVIVNERVGDSAGIVVKHSVGVVIDPYDRETYRDASMRIFDLASQPDIQARCRNVAETLFSLGSGVDRYESLYRTLR